MKIKFNRNTKIRTKLILLGAVSILGMFVLGSESVSTAWQIDQVGEEISNTWINAVIIAEELNTATSDYRIRESRHAIAIAPAMMEEVEAELKVLEAEIAGQVQGLPGTADDGAGSADYPGGGGCLERISGDKRGTA